MRPALRTRTRYRLRILWDWTRLVFWMVMFVGTALVGLYIAMLLVYAFVWRLS